VEFPTLCYRLRNLLVCRREQSACHVVSTWRVLWVPGKVLCGGIPVSVITLMTLVWCCFMAHFDLFLRLGGSLQPKVLVLETLAAVFIFDVPFIITWVNNARNSWMNEEQSINQ